MERVTQAHVARLAGVDKATVSRALAGAPCVLPETAARVKAAARQLGYQSDPMLAAVAASRWRGEGQRRGLTFGFITQFQRPHAGEQDLWRAGAETRATQFGCRLDGFTLEDYANSAALQRTLLARGLTGLIIAPFFEAQPALTLDWSKFCAVSIDITPHQPPLHAVAQDAFDGAILAWQRVRAYGYHRLGMAIALHGLPTHVEDDDNRRAAALLLHNDCAPSERVPPLFHRITEPYEAQAQQVVAWYRRWKPDAVIGFNMVTSHILVHDAKVRIPRDVGIALLTTLPAEGAAGIKEAAEEAGSAVVDLLQQTLRTNQWGLPATRIRHYLEPQWLDGPTLPRRSAEPVHAGRIRRKRAPGFATGGPAVPGCPGRGA